MPLNVREIDGFGNTRLLIQLSQVAGQIGVIGNTLPVALEVADVDGIEAHQSGEQSPVGLGDLRTDQIALAGEALLHLIQRIEQAPEGPLVGRLTGGEAGAVDAVVDVAIDESVDLVDLLAQGRRVVVGTAGVTAVEGAVEHADDLRGLVVDDGLSLLVPQHRHSDDAGVVGLGPGVDLVHEVETIGTVIAGALERLTTGAGELPARIAHVRVHHRQGNHVLQPLQPAEDQGAMGPGAGVGNVQVITPGLGLEATLATGAGAAVRGDPVAKLRVLANEFTVFPLGLQPVVPEGAVDQQTHALASRAGWLSLPCTRRASRLSAPAPLADSTSSPPARAMFLVNSSICI